MDALKSLKNVKEKIQDNYTSAQLLGVLDLMLLRSISPIIHQTHFIDRALSLILYWYTINQRRRISPLSKKDFNRNVIQFLGNPDNKQRCILFSGLKLERNITFFLIRSWLSEMRHWPDEYVRSLARGNRYEKTRIEKRAMIVSSDNLLFALQKVRFWEHAASEFKNALIEKYMRLIFNMAHQHYAINRDMHPHLRMDLEEIAQDFILAAHRGIDKCDAEQGTLTYYLETWLRNARGSVSHFRHEYGVAYSIPASVKRKIAEKKSSVINIALTMDEDGVLDVPDELQVEEVCEKRNYIEFIRKLARYADPLGYGRIRLGIGEVLNEEEISKLQTVNANCGTN